MNMPALAIAGAFVALLTACHSAPQPKSAAGLQGRSFLLQSNEGAPVLDATQVRLSLTDADLSMTASERALCGRRRSHRALWHARRSG